MTGTIRINNRPQAAKIGGIVVFTYEGAENAYRTFARRAQREDSAEAIYAMSDEFQKMLKLGFTPDALEQMEIEEM